VLTRIIVAHHEEGSGNVTYPVLLAPLPPGTYELHLAGHAPREVTVSPGLVQEVRWTE
jgi:hypothetical protein